MCTIHSYDANALSHPSCIAIEQDLSLTNIVFSTFKSALRPLISLYSGTMNKLYTGNWLTSSRVFSNRSAVYLFPPPLSKLRKEIASLKANSHLSIHTGCMRYVPHSTALVIGKDNNSRYYSLFFDPQGKKPSEASLIHKDFEVEKNGRWAYQTIHTVEELYREVIQNVTNPPPLHYSSSYIQSDWITCAAYTSVFLKELEQAEKEEGVHPEHLMKDVANHQLVTFAKVCDELSKLYDVSNQEAQGSSLDSAKAYAHSLDSEWDIIKGEIPEKQDRALPQSSQSLLGMVKYVLKFSH